MTDTITLFCFGPGFGLPELSPFCTKTEIQLKLAELPYRKEKATPDKSPKGQLPYIDDQGTRIADSHFIRAHLERKYGVDLDDGLTASERAQAWAIERMLENHFLYALAYERWLIPVNFERGPAHFFDDAPEATRDQLREDVKGRVTRRLFEVEMTRHSEAEIIELGERSLLALSALLGDRPYLMGERPTGIDAAAFGMLAAVLTPFFESPLRRKAETFPNLAAYTSRLMHQFFPRHAWGRVDAAA